MSKDYPRRDVPVPSPSKTGCWGSDVIADAIRDVGIRYLFVNPGASFRGLHDSLVNHLGNHQPQMLLVLHEEHGVAMAHGYAKVTGDLCGAIVHSNVGLMHASMAIFNAWADRTPVLVLGATGPVDAAKRRPWIDWIHTAQDQGALVRHFVKWDAQPASPKAAQEAIARAVIMSNTAPQGPTYVCFDAAVQEAPVNDRPPRLDRTRYPQPAGGRPLARDVRQVLEWVRAARRPVVLMGRVSRNTADWEQRVRLVESWGALVLTDLKLGAAFPTSHGAHAAAPGFFLSHQAAETLRQADLIISLDWLDLAGTLGQAFGDAACHARVVHVSLDQYVHNGWSMDHQALPQTDLTLLCDPDTFVASVVENPDFSQAEKRPSSSERPYPRSQISKSDTISIAQLAADVEAAAAELDMSLIRLPLGWSGDLCDFDHPLDYLGYDGGGGIGSGPGMAVGAALGLKDSGRLPVAIIGDGDYLMGVSALWTAANARIPLLIIVANNRSFFNDELHQERVARDRSRPIENRWIGQRIDDPAPDLAGLARAQGLTGFGPVSEPAELVGVLRNAVEIVRAGGSVVVDVHVTPGYSPAMSSGMTRSHDD